MSQPVITVSFSGPPGEAPILIDLTMDEVEGTFLHASALALWSFDHDPAAPRETVEVQKLNSIAPVLVYRGSMQCDDRSCVICQDDFRPRKHVRRLPCGHVFCSKCISKWTVRQSATCPTCRCSILA